MWRGRLALMIVILCFVCLLALKPQPANTLCTQDTIRQVQHLITKTPDLVQLGCKLYTPTPQDYQNCPSSTFRCFADEIKVLNKEWEWITVKNRGIKLNMKLKRLAESFNQKETGCRQCELLREQTAETFLSNLSTVLMMMNSQYCPSPSHPTSPPDTHTWTH
ncbi:interleukin-15 isoform X1 [Solea senegalensis]|uniref:Interleukin n=1 Tax=Solea senegalensis TaxID=28829 RepID=A0AAV6Q1X9_SOLSE|nr:interleukin-15 isoform X1 [Solea senegalensis]